jgi:hypothetical protein
VVPGGGAHIVTLGSGQQKVEGRAPSGCNIAQRHVCIAITRFWSPSSPLSCLLAACLDTLQITATYGRRHGRLAEAWQDARRGKMRNRGHEGGYVMNVRCFLHVY